MKESSKDLGYEDSRSPNLGQSKESLEKVGYRKRRSVNGNEG